MTTDKCPMCGEPPFDGNLYTITNTETGEQKKVCGNCNDRVRDAQKERSMEPGEDVPLDLPPQLPREETDDAMNAELDEAERALNQPF